MKVIVFLLLTIGAHAQDVYYVAHVQGKVKKAASNKILSVGDTIFMKDSVVFSSKSDFVSLVGKKGGYVLRYSREKESSKINQFLISVADAFLPSITTHFTQTRAGELNSFLELETFLGQFQKENNPMLLAESFSIGVSPHAFQLDEQHFFFIRFVFEKDTISKKLPTIQHEDSTLIILDGRIFSVDGYRVSPENIKTVRFAYRNAVAGTSREIADAYLNYVLRDSIEAQLATTKLLLKKVDASLTVTQVRERLYSFLRMNYGQPDEITSIQLLNNTLR